MKEEVLLLEQSRGEILNAATETEPKGYRKILQEIDCIDSFRLKGGHGTLFTLDWHKWKSQANRQATKLHQRATERCYKKLIV